MVSGSRTGNSETDVLETTDVVRDVDIGWNQSLVELRRNHFADEPGYLSRERPIVQSKLFTIPHVRGNDSEKIVFLEIVRPLHGPGGTSLRRPGFAGASFPGRGIGLPGIGFSGMGLSGKGFAGPSFPSHAWCPLILGFQMLGPLEILWRRLSNQ